MNGYKLDLVVKFLEVQNIWSLWKGTSGCKTYLSKYRKRIITEEPTGIEIYRNIQSVIIALIGITVDMKINGENNYEMINQFLNVLPACVVFSLVIDIKENSVAE